MHRRRARAELSLPYRSGDYNTRILLLVNGLKASPKTADPVQADSTMQPDSTRSERIAALNAEIESIRFADKLFWQQEATSSAAKAEYQRRQDRLEEAWSELVRLRTTQP